MKKYKLMLVLSVILFITNGRLSAQDEKERKLILGVNAGPLFSKRFNNNSSATEYKIKPGYLAGIAAQYSFVSRFAIRLELNYERYEISSLFHGFYGVSNMNGVNTIIDIPPRYIVDKTNGITVPITLKYDIIHKTKTSVFVDVGSYIGITFENISENSDLTAGFIAGVGVQRSLGERLNIQLELRGRASEEHIGSGIALFGIGYKI